MNFSKKKIIYILAATVLYVVLLTTLPKLIGALTMIAVVGAFVCLFKGKGIFKEKDKVFKTLTTIGLLVIFLFCGIGGISYDPTIAKQTQLKAEQQKIEKQNAKEEQEKKDLEEKLALEEAEKKEQEELAKKEAEEKAKLEAEKKAEEERQQTENEKKAEEERQQAEAASAKAVSEKSNNKNNETQQDNNKSVTVYTTDTGSKYHTGGCQYLRKSKIPITLSNANASGLTPCSKCHPPR